MAYNDYDYDPDDPDAPQPMDLEAGEDEDDVVTCSHCGRALHASAAVCPHCGEWMVDDSPAGLRSRGWFWPLVIGLLVALILVFWVGLRF